MITYTAGDVTKPIIDGQLIIAHVVNNLGGWGRGTVLAISEQWPKPERMYRDWFKSNDKFLLGEVQFVIVSNEISVANMLAQKGFGEDRFQPDAVESCLNKVAGQARITNATIHMPRICCGLGGASWQQIEPLIEKTMNDIQVYIYDYNKDDSVPWRK